MENDVLKNRIVPWQEKGRWYHGIYDNSAASLINDKTDQYIIDNFTLNTSTSYIFLGPESGQENIKILDIVFELHNVTAGNNQILNLGANKYVSTTGFMKPSISHTSFTAGTVEFWMFVTEI